MKNTTRLQDAFLLTLFGGFISFAFMARTDDPFWFNLALNRTVTQSTTATDGEAEKAVDGIAEPGYCAKTDGTSIPYLIIDLGEELFPTYIRLQLNREIQPDVYPDLSIRFGNSPDHLSNKILRTLSTRHVIFDLGIMSRGRYVSVELVEAGVLSICEIFVVKLPFDQIGYEKPVEVSKRLSLNLGDDYGRKHHLSNNILSLTAYSDWMWNPWIRLDLEDSYFIRELDIFVHGNQRILDFAIRIGRSLKHHGRANPSCAEHQNLGLGEGRAYFCRMKGRYIVITVDTMNGYQVQVVEMLVNPTNQKNHAESLIPVTHPGSCASVQGPFCWTLRLTDNFLFGSGFISMVGSNGNWLRLDLGMTIPVGKIIIGNAVPSTHKDQMVDFEIRVGDSLDNNGNSNPLCLEGLQSTLNKIIESFYCESAVSGRYVNLNQKTTDKHLALTEIAVYSDFEPKMKDRFSKRRQIWRSIGDNIVLKCAAYGQPKPVISWMKDGEILKTDSDTIEINSASVEDSGVYECWANNTHGAEYMPFHVNITSNIRPCADSLEIELDLGNSETFYPDILGNEWYRFYDAKSFSYLKMVNKTPKKASECNTFISDSHPKTSDTVVTRTVCVKEKSSGCNRQFEIRIRNCLGYYIYNLPWSHAVTKVGYCFQPDKDVRPRPAIYMRGKANHALFNHVLQVEMDVQDSSQCMILCNLRNTCQSFNHSDKKKVCQLNSSTKQKHPQDFKPKDGFHYYMQGKGVVNKRFAGEL